MTTLEAERDLLLRTINAVLAHHDAIAVDALIAALKPRVGRDSKDIVEAVRQVYHFEAVDYEEVMDWATIGQEAFRRIFDSAEEAR